MRLHTPLRDAEIRGVRVGLETSYARTKSAKSRLSGAPLNARDAAD